MLILSPSSTVDAAVLEPVDWSSAEAQADWHRRVGHARAIAHLVGARPGEAYREVMRAYLRQVRVLGLSYAGIPGRPYDEGGPIG